MALLGTHRRWAGELQARAPAGLETVDGAGVAGGTGNRFDMMICRQWRARRSASKRMVPLDCGCGPDPWLCRCTEPPLSDVALAGWRDAAQHLLDSGRMPLVPLEVQRELYRRGGDDRSLAKTLHAGCGGKIA
jgi:hypothetical protein